MPNIQINTQTITQITVVDAEPERQAEALSMMAERARFMARQPGFVSISLHRSLDAGALSTTCNGKTVSSCSRLTNHQTFARPGGSLTI
jgi:hypothetical protein